MHADHHLPAHPPALDPALRQVDAMLAEFATAFPDDTSSGGRYRPRRHAPHAPGANVGWTTGFWTGTLWLAWELSGQARYREAAVAQTRDFARRLSAGTDLEHHDLGFLYLLSNVAADRLLALPGARVTALAAARRLLHRFLPGAGVIQAWGAMDDPEQRGRVIVDCMMNLPLLHWATAVSGDPQYQQAARIHLQTTCRHLVRPDGSTCHTFYYDPDTGAPLREATHQGLSDSSCWSRGQAWAIYGLALNHRHAPDLGLLERAAHAADYFLAHLPPDGVALWDLGLAHDSGEPRDSSASAIAACGLLELAAQLPRGARRDAYQEAGRRLVESLFAECAVIDVPAGGLLRHGTYHRLAGLGVDECTLWGDYYYLEALARLQRGWSSYDRAPGFSHPARA